VRVAVPFGERRAERFNSDRVEARRAFPQLMSMVQAAALLHQFQREKDGSGALLATAEDYHLARYLLLKPMSRLLGGQLSDPARRFFDRLQKWATGAFTSTEAKQRDSNSKSSVHNWLAELHDAGLVNLVESGRGRTPATWKPSGTSPDDAGSTCLPAVEELFPGSGWQHGRKPEA